MAIFDRTISRAEGRLVLVELDGTGETGEFDETITIPEHVEVFAALLEEGDASDASITISVDDAPFSADGRSSFVRAHGPRRLFTRVNQARRSMVLKLRGFIGRAGARLKISVLMLLQQATDVWGRIACPVCKRLTRFLITSLLVSAGVPAVPLGDEIPEELWTWLHEHFGDLMRSAPDIFGWLAPDVRERFFDALRWALGLAHEVLAPLDRLLTGVCRRLGCCP